MSEQEQNRREEIAKKKRQLNEYLKLEDCQFQAQAIFEQIDDLETELDILEEVV